jgi:hypothetical protein
MINLIVNNKAYNIGSIEFNSKLNIWTANHKVITIDNLTDTRRDGPIITGVGDTLEEAIRQLSLTLEEEHKKINPQTQK